MRLYTKLEVSWLVELHSFQWPSRSVWTSRLPSSSVLIGRLSTQACMKLYPTLSRNLYVDSSQSSFLRNSSSIWLDCRNEFWTDTAIGVCLQIAWIRFLSPAVTQVDVWHTALTKVDLAEKFRRTIASFRWVIATISWLGFYELGDVRCREGG